MFVKKKLMFFLNIARNVFSMSEEVSGVSRCYSNVVALLGLSAGQLIIEGKNVALYFKPVRCQH